MPQNLGTHPGRIQLNVSLFYVKALKSEIWLGVIQERVLYHKP